MDNVNRKCAEKVSELVFEEADITSYAISPLGGCAITYDANGYYHYKVPDGFGEDIDELHDMDVSFKQILFTPTSGYLILYGRNGFRSGGLPSDLLGLLKRINDANREIRSVALGPDEQTWVVLYSTSGHSSSGTPDSLDAKLLEIKDSGEEIEQIAFTPDNGWIVLRSKNGQYAGYSYRNIRTSYIERLELLTDADKDIWLIAFGN